MDEYSGITIQSIGQKRGCIRNKVYPANEYFQYFSREAAFFDVEKREEKEG
jgi:hypothetical protein